ARETTIEALADAGLSGDVNGPLFLAAPPIEPEWSARFELADRSPASDHPGDAYERFLTALRQRFQHQGRRALGDDEAVTILDEWL
ncbi:hypothetical protein ACC687_39920, partial [Rhizobium ruizarguesonis]